MGASRRKYSTKSLTLLAENVTNHLPPCTLDAFFDILTAIDEEIHSELTRTKSELKATRTALSQERELRRAAETKLVSSENTKTFAKPIASDPKRLLHASPEALVDLLLAREDAFYLQGALVDRLKSHNAQLRQAYKTLAKSKSVELDKNLQENSLKTSLQVTDGIDFANDAASTTESGSDVQDRDSCDAAAVELLNTIAIQQRAHEKLRATVVELTAQLGRIDPRKAVPSEDMAKRLKFKEQQLFEMKSANSKKELEISELKKQLKKVLAEYEAVSVAHSYSNAELSKIRANVRGKAKGERPNGDKTHNALGSGVENLLHHKKIHFR